MVDSIRLRPHALPIDDLFWLLDFLDVRHVPLIRNVGHRLLSSLILLELLQELRGCYFN